MIQFSAKVIGQQALLDLVSSIEHSIGSSTNITIPCREILLPVVFDHPALAASEQRYIETNREKAVYLPDNLEYLRTNNGLSSRRQTFETLLSSPYLIVAVGFLVGTPILFPLEPLSGIVAQKYNPTRVSTPGGTIGMGGSLFAIYPLEAPGGYMMFARTMECWDTFGLGPSFTPTRPWLFESFDMVRYHEVSVAEYDRLMLDYKRGVYAFDIRDSFFDLHKAYQRFESARSDAGVLAFRAGQAQGIAANSAIEQKLYGEWVEAQEAEKVAEEKRMRELMHSRKEVRTIDSPIDANVWKVLVQPGEVLKQGQVVAILEAMKMEINVLCDVELDGATVEAIASKPGTVVAPGAWIIVIQSK
jgi:urea carboxylase